MFIKVSSIDRNILIEMNHSPVSVFAVFDHVIHLRLKDHIMTLGASIGQSKHHIEIDDKVNFKEHHIVPHQTVISSMVQIMIQPLIFVIPASSILDFKPFNNDYHLSDINHHIIDQTINLLKNHHPKNYYAYDLNDHIAHFTFLQVTNFFEAPNLKNAYKLIGLGEGLTPLGDDILLGYLLAHRVLNQNIAWFDEVLRHAKTHTNLLAYQNYLDIFNGFINESFIIMSQGFLKTYQLTDIKPILHYGKTSGAGIMTGFLEALKTLKGERHETTNRT